jgi:hypothetical protein
MKKSAAFAMDVGVEPFARGYLEAVLVLPPAMAYSIDHGH